ncbi:MAG: asparagine synthase B [Synergistota bacterium]|nr:asparagine synthase B [Synergistota bacterium]
MCGICGTWEDNDEVTLLSMMESLSHRGPDATGMLRMEKGALGHRRLSIMDPEKGDNPLYNENGKLVLRANGEIYNHESIRKELSASHVFATDSDIEAVLHLYEEKGPEAVRELDGMFALCITDGETLFLARDPLGIKPLYYGYSDEGALCFASEVKAFTSDVTGITEFPPGTWYHSGHGFNTFYNVPEISPLDDNEKVFEKRIKTTLENAVSKRLMSDVPLGVFLSGGLDSSIIAALAARDISPLHSFSTGTRESGDLEAAERVADFLGTEHHECILNEEDISDALPMIIYHLESFDQDLVRTAVPCYFTSGIAAQHVKVILTGEGADELFAGYTYYADIESPHTLQRELRRSLESLHNINLQRVDRMTMAQSLEGRVPFLDTALITLAQEIPPELKRAGDPPVEKWILRKSFEGILPDDIIWRKKEQFDEGSGVIGLLRNLAGAAFDGDGWKRYRSMHPDVMLRSAEECMYHRIFHRVFHEPSAVEETVARWSVRPALS